MRICLFTPTFLPSLGGAEIAADRILRGLQQRGHDVFVLCQDHGQPPADLPYPVRRYRRLPSQHLWPELLAVPLYKAWRKWRFDHVLAFYGYPTGYAASLLKKRLNFRLIVSARGADLYPHFHALNKPRVKATIAAGYRRADRIVSVSQWLSDRIVEVAGQPLPPIDVVPNGIDLAAHDQMLAAVPDERPTFAVEHGIEPGKFLLHLARVGPVKRQDLAVEGVQKARHTCAAHGFRYVLVGDGDFLSVIEKLINENNLHDIVKLVGRRTGSDKAWLLKHAAAMVSTSREEGLPNSLIEAMASGLPVVASDIGPHRELIEGRGWGELFRAGDADDLAAKLVAMIERDRQPMRAAAMALRQQYGLEAMIDGYERAISGL